MSIDSTHVPVRTRSRVLLLTILGVVVIGLLGMASVVDRDPSARAASNPNVKILAKKTIKSSPAPVSQETRALFKTGGVRHRAICQDAGVGEYIAIVQARSTRNDGYLILEESSIPFKLTNTWKNVASVSGGSARFARRSYDTLFKDGTFRHYELVIAIHAYDRKCTARLVATSA